MLDSPRLASPRRPWTPANRSAMLPIPRTPAKHFASPESQRPRTPDLIRDPAKLNADQICIYRHEGTGLRKRSVIAIAEYKPPHKLTLPQLRKGLHDMHIFQDVVRKNKIPTEAEAKFQHYAEELTAAAITQTYHYMIKGGLAYSLLTTGEAIVFLKIDWRAPEVLYYHLKLCQYESRQWWKRWKLENDNLYHLSPLSTTVNQ
jgi:hypothetical protein